MKIQWPFVSKKKYFELEQTNNRLRKEKADEYKRHKEEVDKLLKPMVEKFTKCAIERFTDDYSKYGLRVMLDAYWVERCLWQGNSESELNYLQDAISGQVARKLRNLLEMRNFVRVSK